MDDAGEMTHPLGAEIVGLLQDLGQGADRGHRRAQLVGDLREEGVLLLGDALQRLVGLAQLGGGLGKLARFLLEAGGILHDLHRLAGRSHEILERNRLAADDLADEGMGRGGADRAGQAPFELGDETRRRRRHAVGPPLGESGGTEELARLPVAENAPREQQQIARSRLPRSAAQPLLTAAEHPHELGPLHMFERPVARQERDQHEGTHIEHHAPDEGMDQRVGDAGAEKGMGAQPGDAEGAVIPDGAENLHLTERGQEQRPAPYQRPERQPREGARTGGAFPVERADERWDELGDADEGDQPHRGQRRRAAGNAVIAVAEGKDGENREPPREKKQLAHVADLGAAHVPQSEPERQHHMVRHHGRKRDRRHDHHGGRRGKAAEKGEERQILAPGRKRQGEDEQVGIAAFGQERQAGRRDRQHEERDHEEIEREGPCGDREMAFVGILDHHHLEHAGQCQHRAGREEQDRQPAVAERVAAGKAGRLDLFDRRPEPAAHAPDHEDTDREQGHQLDDRLDGDRHHHPFMAFVGVDRAGAEQDGEEGQPRRHPECKGIGRAGACPGLLPHPCHQHLE